jgi:ClpP class serine protease
MKRHAIRAGEYLAIDPSVINHDADGFYIVIGGDPPENERRGTVCVVHVRGALMHYDGEGGDSYEAIICRVKCALEYDPKPTAIVFRIESPGGVVAGLNETVLKLQRMSKESGVKFYAYVDEMAASAAYAICCACSEVIAPPSAIIGSVGVISTLVSQAKRDVADGLDFRIITSGKRKADGHLHAPISDDAVKAEVARNAELAAQFFTLAGKARGLAPEKLQALEAAIYLGKSAKKVGLVDEVMCLDDVIYGLDATETPSPEEVAPNRGNATDRRAKEIENDTDAASVPKTGLDRSAHNASASIAQPGTAHVPPGTPPSGEVTMPVKLDALIKKTEAAIATEQDAKKLRALRANLAAYASTRADMDGDDDGDEDDKKEDDDDEDDEDESKAKKAAAAAKQAKKAAEAAKHRAKAADHKQKAAEYEEAAKKVEDDEDDEEESEEEAEARLRTFAPSDTHTSSPSSLTPGAVAALTSQAAITSGALADIARLKKESEQRTHSAIIADAKANRRITPNEAKMLAKRPLQFVREFLDMRGNSAVVPTDEDDLATPRDFGASASESSLSPEMMAQIDNAVRASGITGDKAEAMKAKMVGDAKKAVANPNAILNGASVGRF